MESVLVSIISSPRIVHGLSVIKYEMETLGEMFPEQSHLQNADAKECAIVA